MPEKELKPKAKEEVPAKAERVRPGRVFLPAVDIFETPEALTLVADMPGVPSDKITVDLRENHLIIHGEIVPPMGPDETLAVQLSGKRERQMPTIFTPRLPQRFQRWFAGWPSSQGSPLSRATLGWRA